MSHRLLDRQLAKSKDSAGGVDLDKLVALVGAAYEDADRDRRRTNRSIELMIEEIDQAQKNLLGAIDLVPQGMLLLDADDCYVLWNKRYSDIYSGVADGIQVGAQFADTLTAAVRQGLFVDAAGREESWLVDRLEAHAQPRHQREELLSDGRWIQVEERRTADGGSIGLRIDITELKRREESFRLLFDGNPVPMWVYDTETSIIVAANESAAETFGVGRDRYVGMSVLDLLPPQDRDYALSIAGKYEGKVPAGASDWRFRRADGRVALVEVYARSLTYQGRPCRIFTAIDVTEGRKAEDSAKRAQAFLDAVIENVPAPIMVKQAKDLSYVLLNRAAEQFLGVPRNGAIGKTGRQFLPPSTAEEVERSDRSALDRRTLVVSDPQLIERQAADPGWPPAAASRFPETAATPNT